jgi:hypothetical protein
MEFGNSVKLIGMKERGYLRLHNLQPENPYETVQIVIASKTFRFFTLHKNVKMKKIVCLELTKMVCLELQFFFPTSLMKMILSSLNLVCITSEENGETKLTSEENVFNNLPH